jgi:hypothetical protein
MVFSRRALQERLDALESILTADHHATLIGRLEQPGRDRLAAMWETVLLPALHMVAPFRHESPLADGSRPDFAMRHECNGIAVEIVGDITSVSDRGLHASNPVGLFWSEVVRLSRKYHLDPNHFRYHIESRQEGNFGESRVVLLLPARKDLSTMIKQHIEPFIRGLARETSSKSSFPYTAPGVAFSLFYDKAQRFGGGGHAVYNTPYSPTRTLLYTALRRKRINCVLRP